MNAVCRYGFSAAVLGVVFLTVGCVIPTVSMHSMRDVAVTVSDAESGKPVGSLPFRVVYGYNPTDSPVVFHVEFRTPAEVRGRTDESGRAVVKLADYAWNIVLTVDDKERGYYADIWLDKRLIQRGGVVESPAAEWNAHHYPSLRFMLEPVKPVERPNHPLQPTAALTR
jgi:hypothetical protein